MGNQHSSSSSQPQSPVGAGRAQSHAAQGSSAHAHGHGQTQAHAQAQTQTQAQAQAQAQTHAGDKQHQQLPQPGYRAGRRASIQPVSLTVVAPPSASFESAERGRASTHANSTAHVTSQLRAAAQDRRIARDGSLDSMGNQHSGPRKDRDGDDRPEKQRSRQHTPQPPSSAAATPPPAASPAPPPPPPPPAAAAPPPSQQVPAEPSPPTVTTTTTTTPPPTEVHAIPIDAPARDTRLEDAIAGSLEPADASQDYIVPSSHFSRPPRLPLPIEEELHTPGSPILSPHDVPAESLEHGEVEGVLPRRTSMLSSTTADDDDLGDEFKVPTGRPTVPTLVEWEGGGERVYVTGTFAGWNRKYRLHRNGPSKNENVLSAHVPIHPGTHHLMFIVDNDMMISDKLPTAVDYTNILVNYLEVSYDDINDPHPSTSIIDTTTTTATTKSPDPAPPTTTTQPPSHPPSPQQPPTVKPPTADLPKPPASYSEKKYHSRIPAYLLDLDAPEDSSRFARANNATAGLPTPPSLPMFLSKSILNGTTPMKDDSSVLIMPNHTVLNHLATSSIKDRVLATSATTRYKQKFLTTIMYKPKEEGGEVY